MSRQEMFPKFHTPITIDPLSEEEDPQPATHSLPSLVPAPNSTIVVQKVMGNFARREIYTPQTSALRQPLTFSHIKVGRLQVRGNSQSKYFQLNKDCNGRRPFVCPKIFK